VGSHAVEALAAAGHQLRLLARERGRVERMAEARRVRVPDVTLGDMTDPAAVEAALAGCDAVVHAAAEVGIGRGEAVFAANMAGTRNVLECAARRGLDPIVYVSSVAVMFPPPGPQMTVDDPLVNLDTHYGRSKAGGEQLARRLQAEGAPVVCVYPVGVYGPDDPGLGPSLKGLRDRIRYGWFMTSGGVGAVDVRDLARLLASTLEAGRGARRYMAGGHFLPWAAEADLCEAITGRRVRRIPAPPRMVEAIGHVVDFVRWLAPTFDYPLTHEASLFVTRFVPCDSRRTVGELGVGFRPIEATLEDSIRWLLATGQLAPRFAPRLAG